MFKPLAIRPGIQCQMTKHCQFLSQAKAYNFHLKHSEFVTSRIPWNFFSLLNEKKTNCLQTLQLEMFLMRLIVRALSYVFLTVSVQAVLKKNLQYNHNHHHNVIQ